MKSRKITLFIESDLENVSLICIAVNALCANFDLDDEISYHMELCVAEAVNNSIIHAYKAISGYDVEVNIEFSREQLMFEVCDTGRFMGMIGDNISLSAFDPNDVTTLPIGGLGLFIIHKLMDDVTYESIRGKNILTMTKRLFL